MVMLLDKDDWNAIHETVRLLSVPWRREFILEGMQGKADDYAADLNLQCCYFTA